jgi:hypothetical protein
VIFARPLRRPQTRSRLAWYIGPRVWLSVNERIAWGVIALLCVSILAVAVYLQPDPRGYGTHERLGLPPCGFIVTTGLPCPTCGMTSSFAYMMHGHPLRAFVAQPAGALLCVGTVFTALYALSAAVQGHMLGIQWDRLGPVRVALTIIFVFIGSWGVKLALGILSGKFPVK